MDWTDYTDEVESCAASNYLKKLEARVEYLEARVGALEEEMDPREKSLDVDKKEKLKAAVKHCLATGMSVRKTANIFPPVSKSDLHREVQKEKEAKKEEKTAYPELPSKVEEDSADDEIIIKIIV